MLTDQIDNSEINAFEEQLKRIGFEIEKTPWYIRGSKHTDLKGTETSKELQEIARTMMMG